MTAVERLEIVMTASEKRALGMQAAGASYEDIAADLGVFKPRVTRQRAYEMVKHAEQKLWRLSARTRYAGQLGNCPVEESPLPGRLRNALTLAGYRTIGELAGKSDVDLAKIAGVGRRHGSFLIYALLQSWGVRKPGRFCPKCGSALSRGRKDERDIKCERCGASATISKIRISEPLEVTAEV